MFVSRNEADCVVTVEDVALNLAGSTVNTALCGDLGFFRQGSSSFSLSISVTGHCLGAMRA